MGRGSAASRLRAHAAASHRPSSGAMLHCARKQGELMSVGSKEARRILAYPKSVPACIPAATDETLLRGVGAQCTDAHLLELHAKPLPLLHRSALKSGVHTNISLNRNWARQGRKRNAAFHTGQKKGNPGEDRNESRATLGRHPVQEWPAISCVQTVEYSKIIFGQELLISGTGAGL